MEDVIAGEGGSFEATETITNLTLDDEKPENPTKEESPAAAAAATTTTTTTSTTDEKNNTSNLRYQNVWKNVDEEVKKGVYELWDEQTGGAMTAEMKRNRIESASVVAYDGEKVVAVSTIALQKHQSLWCKVGYFRCIVHSEYRRKGVASQLAIRCKKVLAEYSEEHPDQRIHAMGIQISGKLLGDRGKQPFWSELGMAMVGYSQGNMQLRIAWLDHVRLDH